MPGMLEGKELTVVDVYEAVGAYDAGNLSLEGLKNIENTACPNEGSCGGMFTANTMASISEAIGLALPGSASPPAEDDRREKMVYDSTKAEPFGIKQTVNIIKLYRYILNIHLNC